ncbi:hypothetical protein [Leuconostoc gasicomitatum]|uniref:hypothetical protein n=1 Tax=Leuconostoc gasicomitatum TaxID=115778 RepID=UPI001CC7ABA5|nr:hypothetical protein [Leuconostoc gasicomitatum]MBZ5971610.1 hypothetical protein [Leuconostoc gasicomitatum]
MFRVFNVTSGTWVVSYIVGTGLKESNSIFDAGKFSKDVAKKLARNLTDEDCKYKVISEEK